MSHCHNAAEANKSLDASLASKRTKEGVPSQDGHLVSSSPLGRPSLAIPRQCPDRLPDPVGGKQWGLLAREGGPLHLIADGRIPSDTELLGLSLVYAPGERVLGPDIMCPADGIGARVEGMR